MLMRAQVVCRCPHEKLHLGRDEMLRRVEFVIWWAIRIVPCRPDQDCPADFNEDGVVNAACGSLNAFINTVEAQAGKKIAEADALILIAMAEEVLAALGCL